MTTLMTLRAIKCAEDIAKGEPPETLGDALGVWSAWAAEREPNIAPAIREDGFVDVPDGVAAAFLSIVDGHLRRTNPPSDTALLARAIVARLKGELPPHPEQQAAAPSA